MNLEGKQVVVVGLALTGVAVAKFCAKLYLCIPLGIVSFVLPRVSQQDLVISSLSWGFLFGIVLYGVYDMTNQSLLRNWPLKVTLVDILWGGTLCAISSFLEALLDRWYA